METCTIQNLNGLRELVALAYGAEGPVVVLDDESECLVAMRPAVFERILFDAGEIEAEGPEGLHL